MNNDDALLSDWLIRVKRKANAHACCAARCELLRKAIGVPLVGISATTGTAVVAQEVAGDPGEWTWWVVGLVITAAILTSIQTFLDYGARAERHKAASAGFSSLRRRIQTGIERRDEHSHAEVDRLREVFDDLVASEPIIPAAIWRDIEKKYPRS